jgi:hypothetical protein
LSAAHQLFFYFGHSLRFSRRRSNAHCPIHGSTWGMNASIG